MINAVYIPVIVVIGLIITMPSKLPEKPPIQYSAQEQKAINIQRESQNSQSDYTAILSFIKSKFKKIKKEDAEAISKYLVQYGNENKIDPKFTAALIARESAFNKEAISATGAKGLGQIKEFNFEALKINNPFNIKENVSGTTEYLRKMLNKWETQRNKEKIESNNHQKGNMPTQPAIVKPNSEAEKVELSVASYFKGFSNIKNEGGKLDEKTKSYVNDILEYYDQIMRQSE